MSFDIPTLFLVIAMTSFVLGGALALVGFRQDKVLMIWASALIMHGVVYSLFLLRGRISDILSIIVANVLISLLFNMFLLGLAHFYRLRLPVVWLWAFPVVTALCYIVYLDNINVRIALGGLVSCIQDAYGLWLIARNQGGTRGRGQFIVMSGFVIILFVLLARVLAIGSGYIETPSIFSETQVQQLSFLGVILALLMLSSGLILMVQERLAADLFASRELLAEQNAALRRYSQELEEANGKLELLSNTDPLTGLHNRRYFDTQLAIEGARAKRHHHSFAVIMIDIDHFKKFNDRYGHPAGDACLVKVAAALQAGVRHSGDVLARLGGEELDSSLIKNAR
ncbi:diguanylate cyclase [Rhabdochromatium marinum]|uniref:diguanylate cyclase n=1 Tax=Rhabdochromatium marinum TaxID=48729 RepID=UPI00190327C3|nr:diguanylate cyclase [Rhabdochromatium marinum]MBK1650289.1 hypothetical protein [Rhabdochromatium marinum]